MSKHKTTADFVQTGLEHVRETLSGLQHELDTTPKKQRDRRTALEGLIRKAERDIDDLEKRLQELRHKYGEVPSSERAPETLDGKETHDDRTDGNDVPKNTGSKAPF